MEDLPGAAPLTLRVLRSTPRVLTEDTGMVLRVGSAMGPGDSENLSPGSAAGPGNSEGSRGAEGVVSGGLSPSVPPELIASSLDLQTLQWRNISVRPCCRIPGQLCNPSLTRMLPHARAYGKQ